MTFACAWWLAVFGLWPAADPGHSIGDGLLVWVDLLLHLLGWVVVVAEWRLSKRAPT